MTVSDWVACATFALALLGIGGRAVNLLASMKHDIREALVFAKLQAKENDEDHEEFRRLFDEHGRILGVHGEEIAVLKSKSGQHNKVYEARGDG